MFLALYGGASISSTSLSIAASHAFDSLERGIVNLKPLAPRPVPYPSVMVPMVAPLAVLAWLSTESCLRALSCCSKGADAPGSGDECPSLEAALETMRGPKLCPWVICGDVGGLLGTRGDWIGRLEGRTPDRFACSRFFKCV